MKRNILAFCLVIGLALGTNAQEKIKEKDLPVTIQKVFKIQYPEAMGSTWKVKDGKYKADFKQGDVKQTACFDESGALLSRAAEIPESDLPQAVSAALKSAYTDRAIESVYKVEKAGITSYSVKFSGEPMVKLLYSADGVVVKDKDQEW